MWYLIYTSSTFSKIQIVRFLTLLSITSCIQLSFAWYRPPITGITAFVSPFFGSCTITLWFQSFRIISSSQMFTRSLWSTLLNMLNMSISVFSPFLLKLSQYQQFPPVFFFVCLDIWWTFVLHCTSRVVVLVFISLSPAADVGFDAVGGSELLWSVQPISLPGHVPS